MALDNKDGQENNKDIMKRRHNKWDIKEEIKIKFEEIYKEKQFRKDEEGESG